MRRNGIMNLMSGVLLLLTALSFLCYLVVLINPYVAFNPFPPPRGTEIAHAGPSPTPASLLPPTFTPTNTPTITPTSPPTPTRTPTKTPTITPTWPPTPTPTVRVTRSAYPFTCEVFYRRPEYGGQWSGVAGDFEDLDGNPLPGYHVRVECPGVGAFGLTAGDDPTYNAIYGSEAAWEQACNPVQYQRMEIRVQPLAMYPEADGVTWRQVGEEVIVQLPGYASGSLGYVVCTMNHEP